MKKFTAKVATLALSALIGFSGVVPTQALEMPRVPASVVSDAAAGSNGVTQVDHARGHRVYRHGHNYRRPGHNRGYYRDGYNRHGYNRYNNRHGYYGRHGYYRHGYRPGYYGGYRGYRDYRPGYRYYDGYWFPLGAFAAGAVIGGAIASQPPVAVYPGSYSPSHYSWCASRYRSYRASDNTFQPYNGPRQQCVSPYY